MSVIYAERNALLRIAEDYPDELAREQLIQELHISPFDASNPRIVAFETAVWAPSLDIYRFFTSGLVALALQDKNDGNFGTRHS